MPQLQRRKRKQGLGKAAMADIVGEHLLDRILLEITPGQRLAIEQDIREPRP